MDERKQLKARVSDNIRKEVDAACDALKITKQNFVEQAVLAKLCKIDVDIRAHRLSAENTTLSVERQQFKAEKNTAIEESKRLTIERDNAQGERNHYEKQYEDSQKKLAQARADLDAYKGRGFLARVVNKVVVWVGEFHPFGFSTMPAGHGSFLHKRLQLLSMRLSRSVHFK